MNKGGKINQQANKQNRKSYLQKKNWIFFKCVIKKSMLLYAPVSSKDIFLFSFLNKKKIIVKAKDCNKFKKKNEKLFIISL